MRAILVKLHRYLGLATAFFLAVAGLTGSILAFHHEIDEWLNPSFYATQGGGEPLEAPSSDGAGAPADFSALDHKAVGLVGGAGSRADSLTVLLAQLERQFGIVLGNLIECSLLRNCGRSSLNGFARISGSRNSKKHRTITAHHPALPASPAAF